MLSKIPVYYLDLGRVCERVMRDERLTATAKAFVLGVAYLIRLQGGPVSWDQIERYCGAPRGTLYWSENQAQKRGRLSPMHQAIQAGYLTYQLGRGLHDYPRFVLHQHGDALHQHGDALHQHGDALHQHGDALHQHGDAPVAGATEDKVLKKRAFPPSTQQNVQHAAASSLKSNQEISEISEIYYKSTPVEPPPVDKPVDKRELVPLTERHTTMMKAIFLELGLSSAQTQWAMDLAVRAVAVHNLPPGRLVRIQQVCKKQRGRSNKSLLELWKDLLDHAVQKKLRYEG